MSVRVFSCSIRPSLLALLLLLEGCSSKFPKKEDPYSEFNRASLEFNLGLDDAVLHPTADIYKKGIHSSIRSGIGCFLNNLKEPYYTVNYIFAGNLDSAVNSIFRFIVNTVFGGLGIADVGSHIGLERADTSYSKTLTSLGVETGDYLMLPFLGSSSTRDVFGEIASWFADPLGYFIGFPWMLGKAVVGVVHNRAENDEMINKVRKQSMDLYSVMKSLYLQENAVNSHKKRGKKAANDDDDDEDDGPKPDDDE